MAQRRNLYVSDPIWQRLHRMAEIEDTNLADVTRRVLLSGLGMTDHSRAIVDAETDGDDPVPRLRRELIKTHIDHGKLATQVARLTLALTDVVDADGPRREAWEVMKGAFAQLRNDLQSHIAQTERLLQHTADALAAQHERSTALYAAARQIGLVDLDVLRRVAVSKVGSVTN